MSVSGKLSVFLVTEDEFFSVDTDTAEFFVSEEASEIVGDAFFPEGEELVVVFF